MQPVGYIIEGSVYCPYCAPIDQGLGDDVEAIYSDDEWPYYPRCRECREKITQVSLVRGCEP